MKKIKLIIALFVSATLLAYSQSFEGVIKWKLTFDISDPKMRNNASNNSPQVTEAQRQMMEKMNDPEFKKMLDQNPQMKAQIEKAMTQMSKGASNTANPLMNSMPIGMTIKIKKNNSLVRILGGMMDGKETLYLADKDETYSLDSQTKSYSKLPKRTATAQPAQKPVITKTDDYMTIAGYKCRKYIVEHPSDQSKQVIWASTEFKGLDLSAFKKLRGSDEKTFIYDGIEGIPLSVEGTARELKYQMQVTEIVKQTIDPSEVAIPKDFKER
jgi:hypothetical protein